MLCKKSTNIKFLMNKFKLSFLCINKLKKYLRIEIQTNTVIKII